MNSDCKFIGYVIEELKVKGWFKFSFIIDYYKFRLILILNIIIKKGLKKFESLIWFEQNCLFEYNGIKDV